MIIPKLTTEAALVKQANDAYAYDSKFSQLSKRDHLDHDQDFVG